MTDVYVTLRPPCLCPSQGHKHGVSILKALNIYVTLLQITRENEKQQKPGSWRGCLPISHLSYPRFLTLFIVWLRFSVLITWLVKTENRWHTVSIPIKIEFDYPKRDCVTTVWIYKGLYGNATVLLEKSILLIFCEKNLLLLCCILCCLLCQLLTRFRDLVVLWRSGPHDHFLRLFFLGSAVITMIYNNSTREEQQRKRRDRPWRRWHRAIK